MQKTRSNVPDNWTRNTLNEITKLFRYRIRRLLFFAISDPQWFSWPSGRVLKNRRKCCSRYLWYINESEVENWFYSLSFEISIFCCFWRGLLKLRLVSLLIWLIEIDLGKVKFRPNSYYWEKENKHLKIFTVS